MLFLPFELLVFMRTDLYFLIQDATGCANLYADGSAHLRYLAQRALARGTAGRRGAAAGPDPARALPPRERRAVRAYSWLLLSGTATCLAAAVFITVPAAVVVLAHAFGEVAGGQLVDVLDGLAAIAVFGAFQLLWLWTWWRRRGEVTECSPRRLRRPLSRSRSRSASWTRSKPPEDLFQGVTRVATRAT